MAKQKLITKRKCRNTSYNDSSRYLCFHLRFVLISREVRTEPGSSSGRTPAEQSRAVTTSARSLQLPRSSCSLLPRHRSSTGCWRALRCEGRASPAILQSALTLLHAGKLKHMKLRQLAQSYFAQRANSWQWGLQVDFDQKPGQRLNRNSL